MSTTTPLRIGIAQLCLAVGDIEGNKRLVAQAIEQANKQNNNLLVCPELTVSGYHPQDLLLRKYFVDECMKTVHDIASLTLGTNIAVLLGSPWADGSKLYNAVLLLAEGQIQAFTYKRHLPNYGHFDEKRYASKGPVPSVIAWKGIRYGILIGEDLWYDDTTLNFAAQSVDLIIAVSASPFWAGKIEERLSLAYNKCSQFALPLIYVNAAYAQEDIVLDGSSFVINEQCQLTKLLPRFTPCLEYCEFTFTAHGLRTESPPAERLELTRDEEIYNCLQFGLHDWASKQGFNQVLLMLDSSLASMVSALIAVDSLGPKQVEAIFMPATKQERDEFPTIKKFADKLGVHLLHWPISTLAEEVASKLDKKLTEHNTSHNLVMQLRGLILTEAAEQKKALVLDTTNKTMLALGQATLPAVNPSFSIVKDLWQSDLAALANWRNNNLPNNAKLSKLDLIDNNLLGAPTNAKINLGNDNVAIVVADEILKLLHEKNMSVPQIVSRGYNESLVATLAELYFTATPVRKQAANGIKVSTRDLAKDLRLPQLHKKPR